MLSMVSVRFFPVFFWLIEIVSHLVIRAKVNMLLECCKHSFLPLHFFSFVLFRCPLSSSCSSSRRQVFFQTLPKLIFIRLCFVHCRRRCRCRCCWCSSHFCNVTILVELVNGMNRLTWREKLRERDGNWKKIEQKIVQRVRTKIWFEKTKSIFIIFCIYSQTWANDHHFDLLYHKWPLKNDHLSTAATIFGSQGWSLSTGLTV